MLAPTIGFHWHYNSGLHYSSGLLHYNSCLLHYNKGLLHYNSGLLHYNTGSAIAGARPA